jgi:flavin reductase (DIM6/NTAB) family NADH-FMN oxidoreductase RutF
MRGIMPDTDITRDVLRMFTYGLFVAASVGPDGPRAATVSWVTQASFEPRLVGVAMRKGTAIYDAVRSSRCFTLHIVAANQPDFAKAFFKANQISDNAIAGYQYNLSASGMPVFVDTPAWLECEVTEEANREGDHAIFIAKVVGSGLRLPPVTALPLRETPWHYGG